MQVTGNVRSQELQRNLGITDKLRELVSSIKQDNKFKTKLAENVPQIVVIGMQSAGKSTTLELLSGVRFPQSATMCTRVPIELKLRRGPQLQTRVTLKGPDGYTERFDSDDTTKNIKDAQDRAVEVSGQVIARDYCVEIVCQAEDKVNVTLVDLPGFFAPKSSEHQGTADMVKKMGEEYAQMKNSLVLHVMGIDQDYGNVLTKMTISKLDQNKVINVFTKPDLLVNQGNQEAQDRLNDFLSETSAPRFVVCGKYCGNQSEEVQSIKALGLFQDERMIKIGSLELGLYLEDRISEHLTELLPEFRAQLNKDLKDVSKALESVYKEPRVDEILQTLGMDIQMKWPCEVHNRRIRLLCESMRVKIRQCRIRPIGIGLDELKYCPVDRDELEIGDVVWVQDAGNPERFLENVVYQVNAETITLADQTKVDLANVYAIDLSKSLVEEVLNIMNQRGLTNAEFFDPQLVLDTYISSFAEMYRRVIHEVANEACALAAKSTREMFESLKVPAAGIKVRDMLLNEILESCDTLLSALQVSAGRAVRYCKPPLVYTTNDHYLATNIRDMSPISPARISSASRVLNDAYTSRSALDAQTFGNIASVLGSVEVANRPPTDRSALVETAVKMIRLVEAFWKVKVKMITEYFAAELALVFCVEIQEAIGSIATQVQRHAVHVVEPPAMRMDRDRFIERKRVLQAALALF